MSGSADAFHSLTPRERDCLRLLRKGLLTPQVASTLGISVARLNKHLASARQKLGVSRTAHALLLCPRDDSATGSLSWGAISAISDSSPQVRDFAGALEICATIQEAWDTLCDLAGRLGVTQIATHVIAEPPGQLTNGARGIGMSGPEFLRKMYRGMGGENADPVNRLIAAQMKSVLVDNERLVPSIADGVSQASRRIRPCYPRRGHAVRAASAGTRSPHRRAIGACVYRRSSHDHRFSAKLEWKSARDVAGDCQGFLGCRSGQAAAAPDRRTLAPRGRGADVLRARLQRRGIRRADESLSPLWNERSPAPARSSARAQRRRPSTGPWSTARFPDGAG